MSLSNWRRSQGIGADYRHHGFGARRGKWQDTYEHEQQSDRAPGNYCMLQSGAYMAEKAQGVRPGFGMLMNRCRGEENQQEYSGIIYNRPFNSESHWRCFLPSLTQIINPRQPESQ